jgi:hypothetical protein
MYGQAMVERYDASLRGIVAELLWLVSVRQDPSSVVDRRFFIINILSGYAHYKQPVRHEEIFYDSSFWHCICHPP